MNVVMIAWPVRAPSPSLAESSEGESQRPTLGRRRAQHGTKEGGDGVDHDASRDGRGRAGYMRVLWGAG